MWYHFALVQIEDTAKSTGSGIGGGLSWRPPDHQFTTKPASQLDPRHIGEAMANQPSEIGNTGKAMTPLKDGDQESGFVVQEGAAVQAIKSRNLNPNLPNAVETTMEDKLEALRQQSTEQSGSPSGDQSMGSTERGRGYKIEKNMIGGENNPIGGNPAHLPSEDIGLAQSFAK